jgi:hypothetical protein
MKSTIQQSETTVEDGQQIIEKLIFKYVPSHQSSLAVRMLRNILERSRNQGALEAIERVKQSMKETV